MFYLIKFCKFKDLTTIGHSLGFSPTLDNTKSMKYNSKHDPVTVFLHVMV